jgi:glutamyl-tRNA reductase
MHILTVGMNHKTAPVDIRERCSFSPENLSASLKTIRENKFISEAVIISTCNRTEIFLSTKDLDKTEETIRGFFRSYCATLGNDIDKFLYTHRDENAITHLFEVASGLDSMIIGEPQIIGQVKEAYQAAIKNGSIGIILHKLFQQAITVGKAARTLTGISEGALSVSYAAVELAKKIFGSLSQYSVLLVGAGEMAELTAKQLCQCGIGKLLVANRTLERSQKIAREFSGESVLFDEIDKAMIGVDIVITSTGAPHYLIDHNRMIHIMNERNNAPIFLIDIAVPRDIDPRAGDLNNVFLYNIDDLDGVVKQNIKKRESEAAKARDLISRETTQFMKWLGSLEVAPTIIKFRETFNNIRLQELERIKSKISHLSGEDRNLIDQLTYQYMNKLLHRPTSQLKENEDKTNTLVWADVINQLFGLGNGQSDENIKQKGEENDKHN